MKTKFDHQQKGNLIVCGDLPVVGITTCNRHFFALQILGISTDGQLYQNAIHINVNK